MLSTGADKFVPEDEAFKLNSRSSSGDMVAMKCSGRGRNSARPNVDSPEVNTVRVLIFKVIDRVAGGEREEVKCPLNLDHSCIAAGHLYLTLIYALSVLVP